MKDYAKERFFEASTTLNRLDKAARNDFSSIRVESFRKVIIDLDAAIPGLKEIFVGRAMLIKAQAIWWIYSKGLVDTNIFEIINHPETKDPILLECHELAIKGKEIIIEYNGLDEEIAWATDLIEKSTQ